MARLTAAQVEAFTSLLNSLSDAARRRAAVLLAAIEYSDVADLREKVIAALEPLLASATDRAAAIAASFYDSIREQAIGSAFGAEACSMREPAATEGAIRAIVKGAEGGGALAAIVPKLLLRVDYEVKRAAGECVAENAHRDGACTGYARVPTGAETCGFCLMLASRGFVYRTAQTAGADGHYHAHCDCRIVPGFDGMEVEGYDPDALYYQWKESTHADYMRRRAESGGRVRKHESAYRFSGDDGMPSFESFADVKGYLYAAENEEDLEHRFSVLGGIFGFGSPQMRSQAVRNAVRHMQKRL